MSKEKSVTVSPQFKKWLSEAAELEINGESQLQDPKRQLYVKMAEELLSHNIPKNQVYSRIHRDLQAELRVKKNNPTYILNNSWLYEVCQQNGWTESSLPKNAETSPFEKDDPFKILKEKMKNIFEQIIEQCHEDIALLEDRDKKISQESWMKFFSDETEIKNFVDEMLSITVAHFEDANRLRDSRQIILPTDRFLITAMNFWIYDSWYCKIYHAKVKDRHGKYDITPKKLSLFRKDSLSKSHLIYHVMQDPLNCHILGIKCPGCGSSKSLKTFWNIDGTWNLICTNEVAHNDKKPRYPASLISEYLENLATNTDSSANILLKAHGFEQVILDAKKK